MSNFQVQPEFGNKSSINNRWYTIYVLFNILYTLVLLCWCYDVTSLCRYVDAQTMTGVITIITIGLPIDQQVVINNNSNTLYYK